ncbi:MAG: hypothetical protein JXA71_13605 [Chitinispirillaceae bacterium]|nr:hypothetical protein [Chitinispirillaceae bacterium]
MYLFTHTHQHRTFLLWALLLPLLAATSLTDHLLAQLLTLLRLHFLLPLLITTVSTAAALVMYRVYAHINRRAHEKENSVLFFASMAALMIAAAWWKPPQQSLLAPLLSTLELWIGYGLGLLCFASIGARLHNIAPKSRLAGVALVFLTLALIGLAMGGVAGMGR